MKRVVLLIYLLLMLARPAYSADNECMYDQANQTEVLQNIAAKHPGARVDLVKRSVVWVGKNKTEWAVQYGGCQHLGFTVTRSEIQKVASSQADVLQIAIHLAKEFWDKSDSEDLVKAIVGAAFEKDEKPWAIYYHLKHPYYDEFVIVHEFKDDREKISIQWVRSF